jgi:hypothetical protein
MFDVIALPFNAVSRYSNALPLTRLPFISHSVMNTDTDVSNDYSVQFIMVLAKARKCIYKTHINSLFI